MCQYGTKLKKSMIFQILTMISFLKNDVHFKKITNFNKHIKWFHFFSIKILNFYSDWMQQLSAVMLSAIRFLQLRFQIQNDICVQPNETWRPIV